MERIGIRDIGSREGNLKIKSFAPLASNRRNDSWNSYRQHSISPFWAKNKTRGILAFDTLYFISRGN